MPQDVEGKHARPLLYSRVQRRRRGCGKRSPRYCGELVGGGSAVTLRSTFPPATLNLRYLLSLINLISWNNSRLPPGAWCLFLASFILMFWYLIVCQFSGMSLMLVPLKGFLLLFRYYLQFVRFTVGYLVSLCFYFTLSFLGFYTVIYYSFCLILL